MSANLSVHLRDHHIDFYRGFAFVNMAVYHLLFNLKTFHLIELNVFTNPYTIIWRGFIIGTFLICAGVSIVLLYHKVKNSIGEGGLWLRVLPSLRTLSLAAILVSVATYVVFPQTYIYFGILHFILVAKILALITLRGGGFINLLIGVGILVAFFVIGSWNPFIPYYGSGFIPHETLDMVNVLPWLGVFFIGLFLGFYPFYKYLPCFNLSWLLWLGRKPLMLYLAHQTILFPLVYLLSLIL